MSDSLPGRVLSGAYRIERKLGEGGMGAVYAARHVRTARPYAVKVLLPELGARKEAIARFRREAHALAALGHAHIVAVHDFDETPDGLAFLVMDLLEGEDLAARLKRGPLAASQALAILDAIASALEAAHGIGLVHRDLKPGNVFLARVPGVGERAVLLDFGLAKSLAVDPTQAITATGVVMGTPHYMAPEQAQGGAIDARTDVYALGAILHEMLAGRPPFDAPSIASLFVQILTTPAPSLRSRGVRVHDAIDAIAQRCLAKEMGDRFADATALRRALHAIGPEAYTTVPATLATSITPQTRATPASPPRGAHAATPIGNAFAPSSPGDTRVATVAPRAPGGRVVVGVMIALAMFAGVLVVAALVIIPTLLAWRAGPDAPDEIARAATQPQAPAGAAPEARVEPPPDAAAHVEATSDGDAEEEEEEEEEEEAATAQPEPRRARRRSPPPPSSPVVVAGSSVPLPPGVDTAAPGFDRALAARERISAGDWPGCVRALVGAPATLDVLWLRASCAHHGGDRPTLQRTCDTIQRDHAASPYARTCPALLISL